MLRLHGVLIAIALTGLATPAGAADVTRVRTAGEPGVPVEIDLSVRWDRNQERATISHESGTPGGVPGGLVGEAERLNYQRTTNAIVSRLAVGIWHDLELHGEVPYVLGDEATWEYGSMYGKSSAGTGSWNIANPGFDASGCAPGATTCTPTPASSEQLFPLGTDQQAVYKGGRIGDVMAGIAWAPFTEKKDPTGPTWVVGLDVTLPTAQIDEPAKDRITTAGPTYWSSPYTDAGKPGPFGERIWKWDVYTAVSKRMGSLDPYLKAHAQAQVASSSTYSNCNAVDQLVPAGQMQTGAQARCNALGSDAGAQLPWVLGVTFGTEIVTFEDVNDALTIDLRLWADYKTKHRFYNELTDMTGKIHMTEGYAEGGGLLGLYLKASRNLLLKATASLATRSPHWLSDESDPSNPNFDWRYDAPGRRFRVSEVSVLGLSFVGMLTF
jgi:hypothetical protein